MRKQAVGLLRIRKGNTGYEVLSSRHNTALIFLKNPDLYGCVCGPCGAAEPLLEEHQVLLLLSQAPSPIASEQLLPQHKKTERRLHW